MEEKKRGRPASPATMWHRVDIRISLEEKRLLQEAAKARGMSVSEFIRDAIKRALA